ncbi:tannase/feruloyl esterase family alpha/beta hydrolase [Pararhodobacter marinus]|uniref:Tannase/feruloyl esterase family alpha/beta hydrolase n=1 Tax=Pararhodobacter marinus TaxID=2184063 RepID=A0A2U2CD76_9RHOB|nr:tannase/feruloyl esterase family alpha/beta hydrolase [Pararhodobacter marinus]PWE29810.1 tannase/feruloyl esterase family alpha/beta hydrolase [Pararhodobacter marinus]
MRSITGFTSILILGLAGAAQAQSAPATDADFAERCAALMQADLAGGVVTAARMATLADGAAPHCLVQGIMAPRLGQGTPSPDGPSKVYGAGFELRLPQDWSRRFLFQGGGGLDGAVRPAIGADGVSGTPALAQGFAVVATDSGHTGVDSADASFGVDPQARLDNGYNAVDIVATGARALVTELYGAGPDHSYFNGCSNGGRQAMISAWRYPEHFDGIVSAAPAMDLVGAVVAWNWNTRALAAASPTDGNGDPIVSQAFTDDELALIQSHARATCDARDGVEDGLIQDTSCRVDPSALLCGEGESNQCLSQAQVDAVQAIYDGPALADGTSIYQGLMPGAEAGPSGWRAWLLGSAQTAGQYGRQGTYQQDWLRYLAFPEPRPNTDPLRDFDAETDWAQTTESQEIWGSRSTDLDAFRDRGGRMIVWHGTGDPVFSGYQLIDWFAELDQTYGEERDDFARLFFVPGVHHCGGGSGLGRFDPLQAVVDWVENGQAPDQIVTRGTEAAGNAELSRPACPYPLQARYTGSGDENLAENFTCEAP